MDHATMFSYRHSLNGREAAAHLQSWTSEHYTSSAQRYVETYTERSSDDYEIYRHICFILICTDILSSGRKNCSKVSHWKKIASTLDTVLQTKTLQPDK